MDNLNLHNTSPGFKHGLLLILAYAIISILAGLIAAAINIVNPGFLAWNVLLSYIITFGATLVLAMQIWNDRIIEINKVPILVFIILIPASIGMAVFTEGLVSLIPMPQIVADFFANMIKFDLPSYLTVGIVAPLLEELIFRGVVLKGFLKKYDPTKAILLSAAIFAIAHLNPWQGVAAFIAGVCLGWIYYLTRSVWPGILMHFINNSFSFYIGYKYSDINTSFYEVSGSFFNYVILFIGSIIICFIAYKYLHNNYVRNQNSMKL